MCRQSELRDVTYPTKKPVRCNKNTPSITTPNSLDNIVLKLIHGGALGFNVEPTSDDLRRTIFSEKTLINPKKKKKKTVS